MPHRKKFYVALLEQDSQLAWLEGALGPTTSLVACDEPTVDRVLQLADTASAACVFVRFGHLDHIQRGQFVSRMLDRKPNLPVIGLGESDDRELVLSVLRSGARDFVPIGASPSEVHAAIERVLSRHAAFETNLVSKGSIHALICARPEGTSPCLATHLALAIQKLGDPEDKVLLLDLGMPVGDSLLYLDLHPTYSFADAIRSVRRFDQTLIHAAFARHASGVSVLTLPDDPSELESVQAADVVALLGVLRTYFDQIVLNLAGVYELDQLLPMLDKASTILVHTDQCVATCRANYRLLQALRGSKLSLDNARLVVDRFQSRVDPPGDQIAELLGMPAWSCVPPEGLRMLEALNTGQPIFDLAPSCGYSRSVTQLASCLLQQEEAAAPETRLWRTWQQIRSGWRRS